MSSSILLGDWTSSHAGSRLDLSGFHLNFQDNFDLMSVGGSEAATDGALWFAPVRPDFGGATFVGPDAAESPFSVSGGALTIQMQQVNGQWQSGHMQSVNSRGEGFVQQYGYFEMSAKFPAGAGSWPAFWLLSADPTKPRIEIDIVEAYGRDDPDGHHATIHVTPAGGSGPLEKVVNSEYTNVDGSMFDGQFHTYGAMVTPEWIIIYYDGIELTRFPSNEYIGTPLYMAVDLAMYEPEMSQASGRYDMVVDYVRAWADPRYTGLVLNGGDAADELNGTPYADTLTGSAGADLMRGGDGADLYYVDSAGDRVVESGGSGEDLVMSQVSFSAADQHIEHIRLTGAAAIDAVGNELSNRLQGNGADNVLDGGAGADTMIGGAGSDTFHVDDAGDVIQDDAEDGFDLVFSSVSFSLAGARKKLEALTLTGTDNIDGAGNDLRNILIGNSGDNVLNGGAGDDTMQGGLGDDTYYVTDGADKVIEAASEGNDTIVSTWTLSLGNIKSVENLILAGASALNGTGSGGANLLRGNAAGNQLDGREGSDTISGGGGADTLLGGSGQDVFLFDSEPAAGNADRIKDFSSADDTIHLDNAVFATLQVGALQASALTFGKAATAFSHRFVYDQTTGNLFYDPDGAGAGAQTKVAQFNAGTSIALSDFHVVGLAAPAETGPNSGSAKAPAEPLDGAASSIDGEAWHDVLVQNTSTGQVGYVDMGPSGAGPFVNILGLLPAGWKAVGSADLTGDGRAETIIQNSADGAIHYVNTASGQPVWSDIATNINADWTFQGVGDFTLDGTVDVVIRSQSTGYVMYAEMNGGAFGAWANAINMGVGWRLVGVGDTDKDGYADLVVQDVVAGTTYYADMDGGALAGWGFVAGGLGTTWIGKEVADMNGDGYFDVVFHNAGTGDVWYVDMAGGTYSSWQPLTRSPGWEVAGTGDYDADGYADVLMRNPANGEIAYVNIDAGVTAGIVTVSDELGVGWFTA